MRIPFLRRRVWTAVVCMAVVSAAAPATVTGRINDRVQPCAHIKLTAQYLVSVKQGEGYGFLFRLENGTDKEIALADPVPSSAHWYARDGVKWMWRASSGAGGALVDAMREPGPMFAYRPAIAAAKPQYRNVAAHGAIEWEEGVASNPVLEYRPDCQRCNYPADRQYRVIFAYAYLPAPGEAAPGLLTCGLRSNAVEMPPKR